MPEAEGRYTYVSLLSAFSLAQNIQKRFRGLEKNSQRIRMELTKIVKGGLKIVCGEV